uniref:Family with sequence similarity 53 member A n=1 Tax=Sus scrofa TaxID=9823 RepID=A0A4X1T2U1_PIG
MCTVTAGLSRGHPLPLSAHQRGRAAPRPGRAAGMRRTSRPHRLPFSPGEQRPQKVVSGGRLIGSQAATGAALPFPRSPRGPSASLGALSAWDLRESVGPPSAPPTKRHCRSLSEPEELARCRSPWRPGGSKVWTPVPKRRCHSGGSATLLEARAPPRPASASARSGLPDPGPARLLAGPCTLSPRRRLSLSQEHLAEGAAGPPSPLGRRPGLLRCRSQPCVRAGGPGRRKRRLEEDARWPRPALDFLKMTRTLKNSKSLCSLDCEDEEDTHAKAATSSRRDPHSPPGSARPGPASPTSPSLGAPWEWAAGEAGSRGDPRDWDSAGEEGELDLEQIESN